MPEILSHTGGLFATNAYLLQLPGGTVLVDAPEGTAEWVQHLGLKVEALFLTHQHLDHVQDAAAIKAQHGCPIYAFAPFSRKLTLESLLTMVMGSSLEVPQFTVDELLKDQDTVSAVGETWRLYHIPGHSPDSLCFHLERELLLFGGDVLFLDGIGRTDFPDGSTRQLLSGISTKLLPLPDATQVFPGHGEDTTIGRERTENPFLQ